MSDLHETKVSLRQRTEAIVVVPDACLERCKQLSGMLGDAALNQLEGKLDAIVCDSDDRRYKFPRHCSAVQAMFRFSEHPELSPFYVGEGQTGTWVERVEEASVENDALSLTSAYEKLSYK